MNVRDVMTRDPAVCTRDTRLQEVARLMIKHDCGEIPIVDAAETRRPIGVLTDRDITTRVVAEGRNAGDLTAGDCMTTSVVTVTADTDLDACCTLMEEKQLRRMPVVDDRGRCCGIVAQSDIARKASGNLTSELVREVSQPQAAGTRAS